MKKLLLSALAIGVIAMSGCKDDDGVTYRDITVDFASLQVGIDPGDQSEVIAVNLSRKSDAGITVTISLETENIEYGTHFTTTPAVSEGVISLTVPAGETTASFSVNKVAGAYLDGSEAITFDISALSVSEGTKIGTNKSCKVVFGSIVSEGGEMTLEGNGAEENYLNSVYVDFSGNKQAAVNRKSWNIGFYCGDEFRVILNGAYATAAAASSATDINAVGLAEADALEIDLNTAASMVGGDITIPSEAFDSPDGKLATTAFAEISASDADNKVYFVASAAQKTDTRGDWFKVKVTRAENGYRVVFGTVNGATTKTVDIEKNADYNFIFLSLENGVTVNVEPMAAKWDIKWSYDYGPITMGANTYYMVTQDFVSINNIGGAQVATVMTDDIAYDNLKTADITSLTFENDRDVIAASWRTTAGMGGTTGGVNSDRFYVVKDPSGFYYKFRFLRVGINDTGTRGRPELEYALVE